MITRRTFLNHAIKTVILLPMGLQGIAACTAGGPQPPTAPPSAQPPAASAQPASAPVVAPTATSAPVVLQPTRPAAPTPNSPAAPQPTAGSSQPIAPTASPVVAASPAPEAARATPTATAIPYDAKRIKDVLGKGQTSYAGSIPERAHNVELATNRLKGKLVAPGALFSFNGMLGPTTLDAGFKIGYGITLNGDRPETVPSVGGGICQVATTLFHAVYWAGLTLVEHNYHLYWIDRYGQPPSGRVGLDATVDDPYVDFRFRNTTGDWLRVESWIEGNSIGFGVYGVQTGWDVKVSEPVVKDVVKTVQDPVRQEDPTMPAGKELWVEHAEDGFTVSLRRQVFKEGKILDDYPLTRKYLPSRNVLLVGTRGASPTSTVTPAVPPTPTPAPTAAPENYRLGDGKVRVPSLVGMPERQAKALIEAIGLANAHTNFQGKEQVPEAILKTVPVGAVLSQNPQPGQIVFERSMVYLAVRKE
ncbi:MAG: VanW family protein [Chloroflexi bacterium]|nr:VanW family protein [Chloroflexota bacterium]